MSSSALKKPETRHVPFAMRDPLRVPPERYFDREFFELEKKYLWKRSWQMACRLEEIPEPNDYVEYEICDQSVILVRQKDMTVKAYFNVCPHRATQLVKGSGNLAGGQVVCPFHGWRWNANGSPSFIYGEHGFTPECMRPDEIRLQECKIELWGGCAWINLDPNAAPLMESLQPGARMLEDVGVGNYRVKWWKETVVNANWKIAMEAFLEGWHVMQTHPQLTMGIGENYPIDNVAYNIFPNGQSNFQYKSVDSDFPNFDMMLSAFSLLVDGQDAMALDRDVYVLESVRKRLKPGDNMRAAVAAAMRAYNEGAGIPMPDNAEKNPLWWGGEVFLFPNTFFLPMFGNALGYRSRPYNDDPEWCRFEVWSLTTYPESHPPKRAKLKGRFDKEDVNNWGMIPRQDFSNIERQQRGLHALSYSGHRLSPIWENAVTNMHQELDRRLARV